MLTSTLLCALSQILDLQEALLATLRRVETARSDNVRIAGENATLLQYINNMMSATGPPNESVAKAIKAQPKRS
ncbi:hypothetical protein BC832DRAFT_397078 [Gaertneriomyces semiglobifer]|nr:hypothetical protein BC832DRAFT_397078 [Gaertneriomyces semiglobifer]